MHCLRLSALLAVRLSVIDCVNLCRKSKKSLANFQFWSFRRKSHYFSADLSWMFIYTQLLRISVSAFDSWFLLFFILARARAEYGARLKKRSKTGISRGNFVLLLSNFSKQFSTKLECFNVISKDFRLVSFFSEFFSLLLKIEQHYWIW